jgi:long-subunit acyl-CoA synthetase (AMP-forming)
MSKPTTLCRAFQRTAAIAPEAIAVRTVGGTRELTWRDYAEQVRMVAAGLDSLGITPGDTVALMMANRIEFYPIDVGAQHVGATSFSVYNTLSADQLSYVLGNAAVRVMFAEAQHLERITASGVPIDHLVVLDGPADAANALSLDALLERGAANSDFDFEASWRAVQPEDVATLIYTSGTTGNPKGVETTHANLMFEGEAVQQVLPVEFGDRITSYLPSAHIADRFTSLYLHEIVGTQITVVPDLKQIAAALTDCRPTVWGAVPRIWEKLRAAVEFVVANEPDETRQQGLQWALGVARQVAEAELRGERPPAELAEQWQQADAAVLSLIRAQLGLDQTKWAVSGAAPIAPGTLAFFAGLGVPITEIWGMSEVSCIATASSAADRRLGTVGRILPGMEATTSAEGELLIRGPLVMKGYRNDPEKTAEAIDADGWLHTGDVVVIDDDGYIKVVDRIKELIINEAGKNISPSNIENAVKADTPIAGSVVAIGDARAYITALVSLDAEAAAAYAGSHGLADASAKALSSEPDVIAAVRRGIASGNERLSRVEQIKRFRIVTDFWEPGGEEMTLTMKLKRRPIATKYAAEIEELYAVEPGPDVHEA